MPTRDDMLKLHQAITSGDPNARNIAAMFGPAVMDGVANDPQGVLTSLEGKMAEKGIQLPQVQPTAQPDAMAQQVQQYGGVSRPTETAGLGGAALQGIRQWGRLFGQQDPNAGAPPVSGIPEQIARGAGVTLPAGLAWLGGGPIAAGMASSAAESTIPGIMGALIRALGPGAIRGGLGAALGDLPIVAAGAETPEQWRNSTLLGTAIGPAATMVRSLWPGGKGGINLVGRVVPDKSLWRRAKGAIPSLEEYYAGGGTRGSTTAKAIVRQGGILGTPPEPTLKGAAKLAQAKKVAKTAQTGAQPTAGGKPITSQEQLMADIEAEMEPNNVLGKGTPETTGPARTAAPVAPKRVTTKENIVEFGKTGKKTRQLQRETTTTPLGKEMAKAEGKTVGKTTKKAATRKPPERKAAAKTVAKPTPPAKVKKTTPSPLSSGVKAGISSNQIIETIDRLRAAGMPATIDEIATQLKTSPEVIRKALSLPLTQSVMRGTGP